MATKKKTEKPEPKVEAKVEPKVEKPVKCGNCGADNFFGAAVCSKCGYDRLNLVVREGDRVQEYH